MKLFKSSNIAIIEQCRYADISFMLILPSVLIQRRFQKFSVKVANDNILSVA